MEKKSEKKVLNNVCVGPFGTYKEFEGQSDFDKYYYEVTEKQVFKSTGEKDPETGDELGVIDVKILVKKIDIKELLDSQRDTVGVASYMKALALQGESLEDYNTQIDPEKVNDFSNMPDNLADVLTSADDAKRAFANLDPALKGSHTTIEGFLNGLTNESIDSYIKSRVEALTNNVEKKGETE